MALMLVEDSKSSAGQPVDAQSGLTATVPIQSPLIGYLESLWEAAYQTKRHLGVSEEIQLATQERKHQYTGREKALIKGSNINPGVGDYLARRVVARLRDIYFAKQERVWFFESGADPSIPYEFEGIISEQISEFRAEVENNTGEPADPQLMKLFEERLREQVIEDKKDLADRTIKSLSSTVEAELEQGSFYNEFRQALDDIATYPAAIIHGPFVKQKMVMDYRKVGDNNWETVVKRKLSVGYERVHPDLIYPANGAKTLQDSYVIHISRMTLRDLTALMGTPGANDEAITKVVTEHTRGGLVNWISHLDRNQVDALLETSYFSHIESSFDVMIFNVDMSGALLQELDLSGVSLSPTKVYSVRVYRVHDQIILVQINQDPLGMKPYHSASFNQNPDSVWGKSALRLVRGLSKIYEQATRHLANNVGFSSGPVTGIDMSFFSGGQELSSLHPYQYFQFKSNSFGRGEVPIKFFQAQDNSSALLSVMNQILAMAELFIGVTKFLTGEQSVTSAGRTASGLITLIKQEAMFFRDSIGNIDKGIVEPTCQLTYQHVMLHGEQKLKMGDLSAKARGAIEFALKEAQDLRVNELLAVTNNPTDFALMGPEGRRNLLRQSIGNSDFNVDEIVPNSAQPFDQTLQYNLAQQVAEQIKSNANAPQPGTAPGVNVGAQDEVLPGVPANDLINRPPR